MRISVCNLLFNAVVNGFEAEDVSFGVTSPSGLVILDRHEFRCTQVAFWGIPCDVRVQRGFHRGYPCFGWCCDGPWLVGFVEEACKSLLLMGG